MLDVLVQHIYNSSATDAHRNMTLSFESKDIIAFNLIGISIVYQSFRL